MGRTDPVPLCAHGRRGSPARDREAEGCANETRESWKRNGQRHKDPWRMDVRNICYRTGGGAAWRGRDRGASSSP
jgi:hypothetical protein